MRTALIILAFLLLSGPLSGQGNRASVLLSAAIYEEEVSGNLDKAIELYLDILKKYPDDRPVAAKSLYHLGLVNEKLGRQKADEYYTRLVNSYPEQKEMVALARTKLAGKEHRPSGKTKQAEKLFAKAREMFKRWQYDLAITEFDSVTKLVPESLLAQDARYWTGMAWFKSGDLDHALTTFRSLIEAFPESAIVPVTEIMISQVKQAQAEEKKLTSYQDAGDGTITDPASNIKYRKIAAIAGKNDVVTHSFQINSIATNGRFLVTDNLVIPFDASESCPLFDRPGFTSKSYSILSPDATKVAYFTENALEMIPVSPETGRPAGVARKLVDKKYRDDYETFINWSPDGKKLVFLRNDNDTIGDLWTVGINDGNLTRITNNHEKKWSPSFAADGKNILYGTMDLARSSGPNKVWMSPAEGGPAKVIIDSFTYSLTGLQWSPDHNWIAYRINADYSRRFLYHVPVRYLHLQRWEHSFHGRLTARK
ncbi:MAG: tetratricopeptide repeat protein [Bacteroidia bacterium]|nr:tetratricopeptide repeat protein [Bacteroidia bacterium]